MVIECQAAELIGFLEFSRSNNQNFSIFFWEDIFCPLAFFIHEGDPPDLARHRQKN